MTRAERTGLVELLAEKVNIPEPKVKSGGANPAPKLSHWSLGCVPALTVRQN